MPEYVVVEQQKTSSKTASGLYLPDSAKEKPKTAKVMAVGSGVPVVKIGDKVLFRDGFENMVYEDHIYLHQNNIIATVK